MSFRGHKSAPPVLPPLTLDWTLTFKHRATKLALAYWISRRGKRNRPTRADIDPVEMKEFLPNAALVEVHYRAGEDCRYRIRLAGTEVEQVFGPISGRDIESAFPPELATRWRENFDTAREAERPVRLAGHVAFENKLWLAFEALLAPLGDEHEPVSMLYGAFASWPDQERVSKKWD
jgi:hypothetical protein